MSTCSSSGSSCFLDDEELLQFETRCKELRIEKDMLKESSVELFRSLESHAKSLSETRSNDKKRIQNLERELSNCSQEIDYLQDQVNIKDTLISDMADYISNIESKLREKEDLDEIVRRLQHELKARNSENLALMVKLENKEHELHNTTECIEKLEESITNVTLDFQCDIESMKLDLMAMEHSFFEAKKVQEEVFQEHRMMQELTRNCKIQLQEAQSVKHLVKENKALKEKLNTFETTADSENQIKKLHEYELLVNRLKEQLKDEKFKAKEEAEDLAQEMAELRYQLTGLLEEEYKKRSRMEQRALQRITELEGQIEKERRKTFADVRGLPSA